jgi:hypothetical protein
MQAITIEIPEEIFENYQTTEAIRGLELEITIMFYSPTLHLTKRLLVEIQFPVLKGYH